MRMGERNSSMASSSIIPLKGQDFVGGIGKSSELQMHRTAGYFPLPWPAKESSFKTHLPVNILAWLWVISPVSTRPSGAWRCTCTNPETDLVTSDFPFSPDTTSCLIVVMIHPVSKLVSRILKGFLISAPLNLKFASFFDTNKNKTKSTLFEWHHPQARTRRQVWFTQILKYKQKPPYHEEKRNKTAQRQEYWFTKRPGSGTGK